MNRPLFLPSDRPDADILKLWRQHATAVAVGAIRGARPSDIAKHYWGSQPGVCEAIAKAASAPASTGGWGGELANGKAVGAFLSSLAPTSAAARLFAACTRVDLTGYNTAVLPGGSRNIGDAVFVGEGQPIPAMVGSLGGVALGPQSKLAALSGLTSELADYSAENAVEVIELAMRDAAGQSLDAAVFSDAAASPIRPAGLLSGVSPIAATPRGNDGDGFAAMIGDMANLAGAISDAGGGAGVLYFANPRQHMALNLRTSALAPSVIPVPRLPAGTVVAVETGAIASAFDGLPQVDVATAATVHWEDSAPAQIATAGSPNTVAAPVGSAYQTASLVLRMILRCAWAKRMPGAVQVINGANW